jgi:hypothetical protein
MNERELGKRLLDGGGASPDVAALTQRVLQRDRRRVFWLAGGCVVAWMAVVMLPWSTTLPMLAKIVEFQIAADERGGGGAALPATTAPATPRVPESARELFRIVKEAIILTFVISLISMLVAAIFTVSLVVVSRRATLRQVNARLAEISAHVQALTKTQS